MCVKISDIFTLDQYATSDEGKIRLLKDKAEFTIGILLHSTTQLAQERVLRVLASEC